MSDHDPPSSGPEPDEQPEVPTTEVGEQSDAAETPTPVEKPRGRRTFVTVVAAVVVLVLVAGGLGAVFLLRDHSHKLVTPSTAGGMKRDTAKEKELAQAITSAEKVIRSQGKGAKVSYVRSAVYNQDDAKRGPQGALVFLGAKLGGKQKPADWVRTHFGTLAKQNGLKVSHVSPGDGGGSAACAAVSTPSKIAVCAWATEDTIAEIVPTGSGYDVKTLAAIMRAVRADVEKSE